jgi:hypothetical protein
MTVAVAGAEIAKITAENGMLAANGRAKAKPTAVIDLENFVVVKRNGMLVPFRRARIFRAVELAFRATKAIAAPGALQCGTGRHRPSG